MFVGEIDNGFGNFFVDGDFVDNFDEFFHTVGVVLLVAILLGAIGLGGIFDVTTDGGTVFVLVEVVIFSFLLLVLHYRVRYSHSLVRMQVALSVLGRSFECVETSMVGLVDLVVTRVASLVTRRSWLGLPNKFPFVGGRGGSVQRLGDVSSEGLTAGCRSVDTEHVDKIVFDFLW